MPDLTMVQAINAGLQRAMEADPSVVLFGEDIGRLGGVFRVTAGLQERFGEHRVMDAPLAESAIVGAAVGMCMRGYRPVLEMQFDGFVYPAFNQIVSQVAKLHRRSAGMVKVPITIRIPYGGGIGAVEHHSESPETYFAHTAGLRVITPGDAAAAFTTIQQAIACDDPVIYFEPKGRYWDKAGVDLDSEPEGDPWRARVLRPGTDVTLACYGPMVRVCREAAESWEDVSVEVLDLQSLAPIDMNAVVASVRRTGRLVIAHEAPLTLGLGAELAARVGEECFLDLHAPVLRVAAPDVPYPPSRIEHSYLPSVARVNDAIEYAMEF